MAYTIRKVSYFYTDVIDQPGEAYRVLSQLADLGVNLLAFASVPTGPQRTQLTLFPSDRPHFEDTVRNTGMELDGPHQAILVHGDDRMGALAEVHEKLADARVNVFASTGVADGKGCYGYVIYVRPDDLERALDALQA